MHFVVYQSTLLMLDDLLNSAPEGMEYGPLQLGGDFALKDAQAKEFIGLVRRKLDPGSWRRENFENLMRNAEGSAEYELEQNADGAAADRNRHAGPPKVGNRAPAVRQCNRVPKTREKRGGRKSSQSALQLASEVY
jgi:hypothetical protein